MTAPGPPELGRSVVISYEGRPPPPWSDCETIVIEQSMLDDRTLLNQLVEDVQRRYIQRVRTIYRLAADPASLSRNQSTDAPPYELGSDFTFLEERLVKALWHNSYDARQEPPVWWWAHKAAARIGVTVGGNADVTTADGTPVWIDGGPREPLEVAYVVHHESVELGNVRFVPSEAAPSDHLAPDQLVAVAHRVGPARIIAPAGSGKTRVLTSRLKHLIEDREFEPATITAVAYNRRAADEMIERMSDGRRLNIRTIHGLGWAILRSTKPHLAIINDRDQRRTLEPIASAPPRANTDVLGPYIEALGDVRIGLEHPDAVEARRDDVPGFAGTFRRYRDILERNGQADHDEQIYGAIELLCSDPALRAHWQSQCRHMLVDEFQDLTPAYVLLLRLLASPALDVFGVGDDDQVIYGYAGADPRFLLDFARLFPGAESHALEINYRCPPDVVQAAAALLGYNSRRVQKTIRATDESAAYGLTVHMAPGGALGARALEHIETLLEDGATRTSIAVLARVNSSLLPVHVALAEADIAFQSPLTAAVLDRTLLRATLAWIRVALDPNSMTRNDLFEIVRRPGRGITRLLTDALQRRGKYSIDDLIALAGQFDGRRRTNWDSFCDDILLASKHRSSTARLLTVLEDRIGLARAASALDSGRSRADRSTQTDDLAALHRVAGMQPDPGMFEPWLRERLGRPSQPDGIVLSSVHRVKGLEWDHVIVFGADRGTMPHDLSDDIEEERRVFHVALTRGRRSVTVMVDEDRPSRFLAELDGSAPMASEQPETKSTQRAVARTIPDGIFAAIGEVIGVTGGYAGVIDEILTTGVLIKLGSTGATMAVPWGEPVTKAGIKGRLSPGSGPIDQGMVNRLKAWRMAQATAQGVPAYVIFNDSTLESLASRRPSTSSALLEIPGVGPAKLEAYGEDLLDLLSG